MVLVKLGHDRNQDADVENGLEDMGWGTEVTIIPDNFEAKLSGFSGVGGEEVEIASIDYYFVEFCYEEKERYEMVDEGGCEAKGEVYGVS